MLFSVSPLLVFMCLLHVRHLNQVVLVLDSFQFPKPRQKLFRQECEFLLPLWGA